LSEHDVAELALTNDEILHAIESSLRALGSGDTVIEPRRHLAPNETILEHFTAEAFAQLSR
jgi:ornithine cyclodeaminase